MASVRRILAATDRSDSADRAVAWAAEMASRYEAELELLQVLPPDAEASAGATASRLDDFARTIGASVRSRVVLDADPPSAIVRVVDEDEVDVVVVGNVGMSGRREFLLANVPNRVSHQARCTVVIVNTANPPRRRRFGRKR